MGCKFWKKDSVLEEYHCTAESEDSDRDYEMLKALFDANADETITLRERYENLWRENEKHKTDVDRLVKLLSETQNEFNDLVELCEANGLPVTRIKCGKPKLSPKVRLERYGATFCKKCGAPCINQRQGCNCGT